jgi:hypothetical protein
MVVIVDGRHTTRVTILVDLQPSVAHRQTIHQLKIEMAIDHERPAGSCGFLWHHRSVTRQDDRNGDKIRPTGQVPLCAVPRPTSIVNAGLKPTLPIGQTHRAATVSGR